MALVLNVTVKIFHKMIEKRRKLWIGRRHVLQLVEVILNLFKLAERVDSQRGYSYCLMLLPVHIRQIGALLPH